MGIDSDEEEEDDKVIKFLQDPLDFDDFNYLKRCENLQKVNNILKSNISIYKETIGKLKCTISRLRDEVSTISHASAVIEHQTKEKDNVIQ